MRNGRPHHDDRATARARGRDISRPVCAHDPGGQLADRPCRHHLHPARPLRAAGRARSDGAVGRDDGRHCARFARSCAAAARHGHVGAGDPRRQRAVGVVGPGRAGRSPPRSHSCCPNLPISPSIRRWRGVGSSPPSLPRASSAWSWIRLCSCGSPSARSIFSPDKSWARPGWCCCRFLSWLGCAGATRGSASCRHDFLNARRTMSDALFDILRKVTTATITTMLLKKGIRRCWMNGPKPLVARRRAPRRPGLHVALRAGARGFGDAGKLGQSDLDPRRDRGHAGRRHCGRRRHGRAERRHIRRHPLRAHEKAQCHGAGHRRRDARPRRRA